MNDYVETSAGEVRVRYEFSSSQALVNDASNDIEGADINIPLNRVSLARQS